MPFVCNAQMKLELSEIENAGNVYACEDRNEMKAIFYCDSSMVLTFKSGYDDIISLNEVLEGERKSYELVFPTDGKGTSYDGRLLEIYCDGFDVFNMFEFNFPKSTLKEYKVTNRYVKAKNPYFKSVYSGDDLFANSLYEEAKHQYLISKEYPEYETYKESIDSKIQAIDSILVWRERGEKLFSESKYLEAYRYYTAIMKLNPGDKSVYMKTMECSSRYRSDCDIYFSMAEDLYYNKERKSALEYYKKVVEMGCPNATAAKRRSSPFAYVSASPHIVWTVLFIVAPLLFVLYYAFTDASGAFTFDNILALGDHTETFTLSFSMSVVATVLCLLIGYPLAYCIAKLSERAQKIAEEIRLKTDEEYQAKIEKEKEEAEKAALAAKEAADKAAAEAKAKEEENERLRHREIELLETICGLLSEKK